MMMHEWLYGSNATVASERISLLWGEDPVGKSTVYKRFKKFDEDEEYFVMEHWLRDKKFGTDSELHKSLTHFFNSKKSKFDACGIDLWLTKWQEVLKVEGEYFDAFSQNFFPNPIIPCELRAY
ncbi:hypothetical protein KIN20_035324 [Parelaphostrongylus tenuis]|uniref:Uncharacterized protein n=1 Tax=Parelaphostrongylus tenuis TaxID=148309 RepID=A0AAD5RBH2_PARTN|nr:hypothetical protein KIN20_035324 [Parelaphostrongylus tenuis]